MRSIIIGVCLLFAIGIGLDCQQEYNKSKEKLKLNTLNWMSSQHLNPIVTTYKNCLNGEDLIATALNQKLYSLKTSKRLEQVVDSVDVITYLESNYSLINYQIEYTTTICDKNKKQYIFGFDKNHNIIVVYTNFEFLILRLK